MLNRLSLPSLITFLLLFALTGAAPAQDAVSPEAGHPPSAAVHAGDHPADEHHSEERVAPSLLAILPFVVLLMCIAVLPLVPATHHWWEHNSSKLLVSLVLAAITSIYYLLRGWGFPHAGPDGLHYGSPGFGALMDVYHHAVVADYIPFIVLLFSLFTISGGINLRGDLPAHPLTNTVFIGIGTLIASFIGTTGAAMLLIRPLLQVNSERRHVTHTVIFFIFLVANIGGSLLPIGDPPLFLGYLRHVPFLWTFSLWKEWIVCASILLGIYYVWDSVMYRREPQRAIALDEKVREPLVLTGKFNFALLLGVVLAVALLVPGKEIPGLGWTVPEHLHLREIVQLSLAGLSLLLTSRAIRQANGFNFVPIGEVAALFIGIFITMMPAIELLQAKGPSLGLREPWHFFWATGVLSSFLDNAPTYVVFFETAGALAPHGDMMTGVLTATGSINIGLLTAVSCGAVFMGANTYIGNGPNFMVKSIAEQSGVKMPSFFGYMIYSGCILIPLFALLDFVFFWH